ncbi:MAG: uracil-DNA glycosylase [bacterium]|nr:uracil-DNA glycosylase [bacterium]
MEKRINNFIDNLSRVSSTDLYFNPYSLDLSINAIRRNNLNLYFQEVARLKSKTLLLGESPGYQGCRQTGVPFTGEAILLSGIPELGLFGATKGYVKTNEFTKVLKEPTSTIMWSTLAKYNFVPLLWSAFPFHSFRPGNHQSNRTPNKQELDEGQKFYQNLIDIFDIKKVVAVGNVAKDSLDLAGVNSDKIRHPSHGGKSDFVKGIIELLKI